MDKIAVLIPCYNESLTIKKVIEDWKSALPEAKIYVYDNNSTDNTTEIAMNAGVLLSMNINREKVMLSDVCFVKLMPKVIL